MFRPLDIGKTDEYLGGNRSLCQKNETDRSLRRCGLRLALLTLKQDCKTDNLRTLCFSVPGVAGDDVVSGTVSPAPTWHTGALESVPLGGIVRRRDFIHAGHDSDRR